VRKDDTLSAIALVHYGAALRYRMIFAANRRRLCSPHRIYPCQRLYLPRPSRRR
jgi:nucleoid-associated protein YgaU